VILVIKVYVHNSDILLLEVVLEIVEYAGSVGIRQENWESNVRNDFPTPARVQLEELPVSEQYLIQGSKVYWMPVMHLFCPSSTL
jgi:hypothetical protein